MFWCGNWESSRVSIHAPVVGATNHCPILRLRNQSFNPRSRGGSDSRYDPLWMAIVGFNPRSRGGSDGNKANNKKVSKCFNPRSRGGSDGTMVPLVL